MCLHAPINRRIVGLLSMQTSEIRARNAAVSILVGVLILVFGLVGFGARAVIILKADRVDLPITSVSHEFVPQGRGSVMAYVPTVKFQTPSGELINVKVEGHSIDPVYSVGSQMPLLCDTSRFPAECIQDSIGEYLLYPSIMMLIGLGMLFGGAYAKRHRDDAEMIKLGLS